MRVWLCVGVAYWALVCGCPVWAQQALGTFVEFQLADSAGRTLATPADTAATAGRLRFYVLGGTDSLVNALPVVQPLRYGKRGKSWRLPATLPRRPLLVGIEWHHQRMVVVVPAQPGGHWVGRLPFWSGGTFAFARYDFWDTGYGTRCNLLDWLGGSLHRRWNPGAPRPEPDNYLEPRDLAAIQLFLAGELPTGALRW